jgi:hypothetical protein
MAPGDGMPGGPMPHGFFPVSLSVAQNKNDYFVCLGVDEMMRGVTIINAQILSKHKGRVLICNNLFLKISHSILSIFSGFGVS